jgi:hypothetical protein
MRAISPLRSGFVSLSIGGASEEHYMPGLFSGYTKP